jgi:hypothetical protein
VEVHQDAAPVMGATVTIDQPGFYRQRPTGRDGVAQFELTGASAGELRVVVTHPEMAMTTTIIQVGDSIQDEGIGANYSE